MRVTLRAIAERAGVSVSTVGDVLGKRAHLFSPETRRRVLTLAQEMGYVPNGSAKAIQSQRHGAIALLVAYHTHVLTGTMDSIEAVMAEQDLQLWSASVPDPQDGRRTSPPRVLREHIVDGMLVMWDVSAEIMELVKRHGIPFVSLNTKQATDCAYCDEEAGTTLATEHLVKLGHRRIAYVDYGASSHYSSEGRLGGYLRAMQSAGLPPRVFRTRLDPSTARLAHARELLSGSDRPTAVVTYASSTALPILFAATGECRLRVPRDLSLVTSDAEVVDWCGIDIATLIEPHGAVGGAAARLLLEKIDNPGKSLPSRLLRASFVPGRTCAPPAEG